MIVFRADSSKAIGTGHVMRCASLASELAKAGHKVLFVCRDLEGNITESIGARGIQAARLRSWPPFDEFSEESARIEKDASETIEAIEAHGGAADWLIVDHYMADFRWEKKVRKAAKKIMAIDDLANRRHDCDILLDQNLFDDMPARYKGLLPGHCRMLLGPRYALLRPEFIEARASLQNASPELRVFIFFGGIDFTNETAKALEAVRMLDRPDIRIDVVAGPSNPHLPEIERLCRSIEGAVLYRGTEKMAELMSLANLAIGACGTTAWERCCMGLPSVAIAVAENQVEIAENLAKRGLIRYLGRHSEVSAIEIKNALEELLEDSASRSRMALGSKKLLDGRGAERVAIHLSLIGALI